METKNEKLAITIVEKDLQILEKANIIPHGTPSEQVAIFAKVCNEKNLSPFTKQIYLLPFKVKNAKGEYETHYATITGIDGYRAIAERTGRYAGNDNYLYDEGISEYECRRLGKKLPVTATATVYKLINKERIPYSATAAWESYYPGEKKGFNWNRMPFFMLGKCAEALALRKAFPEALGGLHAEEESAAFEILPKAGETIIITEDITKSEEVLAKTKLLTDEFTDFKELAKKYKEIFKIAVKNGLLKQHQKELQDYINLTNRKLKSNETGISSKSA